MKEKKIFLYLASVMLLFILLCMPVSALASVVETETVESEIPEPDNPSDNTESSDIVSEPEEPEEPDIPEHEHIWECTWHWAADASEATLDLRCSSCGETESGIHADVTVTDNWTSCLKSYTKTGTATAVFNGVTYTDTKKITVPAQGHAAAKDGRCPVCNTLINLQTPVLSSIANAEKGVTLKWKAVSGTTYYRIYRKSGSSSWKAITGTGSVSNVKGTSYTDTTVSGGTVYTYTVRCITSDGKLTSSFDSKGLSIRYVPQPACKLTISATALKVTWPKVSGAVKYNVYQKPEGGSWKRIKTTTALSYTLSNPKTGTLYTFTVRAVASDGTLSSYTGKSIKRLTQPVFTLASANTGITIKWTAVAGADSYKVFRKNTSGKWTTLSEVKKGTSYTDTTAELGKSYTYTVRAFSGEFSSTYHSGLTACRLKTPEISGVSSKKGGQLTVSWKKQSGATGFQIQYANNSSFKSAKTTTVKNASATSGVVTRLTGGKVWYVRVRAYQTVGSTNSYSSWSSSLSGKTQQYIIVIDPGHQTKANTAKEANGPGSKTKKMKVTGGATGVSTKQTEYNLNLQIGLKLKKELTARGYKVVMTRTTNNVNISNIQRAQIGNNAKADAVIHIHANSYSVKSLKGARTICPSKKNPYVSSLYSSCYSLSSSVLDELVKATNCKKEGVKTSDTMTGLNWTKVPATIVEVGYLSNAAEDRLLATDSYRNKITKGLANGIDKYLFG